MRWLVEVTSLGKTEKDSLYVDADSWQKALQVARTLRGETDPMSGFSIELLDEGCRAVDPGSRMSYEVHRAPEDGPPPAMRPSVAPRASASVAPPPAAVPAPAPQGGSPELAPRPRSRFPSRPPISATATMMIGAPPVMAAPPAAPAGVDGVRPSTAPARSVAHAPRGDAAAILPSQIVFKREQDATDALPLTYREYVYVVPPGSTEMAAATLVQTQLELVRTSLERMPAGKLVNLAVFDTAFQGKPTVPPLATLAWKDWRGAALVSFPRQPGRAPLTIPTGAPPPPSSTEAFPLVTPAAAAPPVVNPFLPVQPAPAPQVFAPVVASPVQQVFAPVVPPAPAQPVFAPVVQSPVQQAFAPAAQSPVQQAFGPAAQSPVQQVFGPVPQSPVQQVFAPVPQAFTPPPPGFTPAPQTYAPVQPPPAPMAPVPQAFTPPPQPIAAAPQAQQPGQPLVPSQVFAPVPTFMETPAPPYGRPLVSPVAPPVQPVQPSQPVAPAGRIHGEDLIADLFESMHDLHFARDAVEGGDFCLSLAMAKLPSLAGIVQLYDIDRREFLVTSTRGEGTGVLLLRRFPESDALLAAAMRKRRAVVIADAIQTDAATNERYVAIGGARSLIIAPVMLSGRFLGAIELLNPIDGQPFTESDGNAVTYIANQLAEFVAASGIVTDPERISSRAPR
jgi:hypothetical protein